MVSGVGTVRGRRVAVGAFVAYALGLAVVLLSPRVAVPDSGIGWAADAARALGTPAWLLEPRRFEFLSNVLIFVPLPVLGTIAWPATPARRWAGIGLAASVAVEVVQGLALEERSASVVDVTANTLGTLIGVALVAGVRRWSRP